VKQYGVKVRRIDCSPRTISQGATECDRLASPSDVELFLVTSLVTASVGLVVEACRTDEKCQNDAVRGFVRVWSGARTFGGCLFCHQTTRRESQRENIGTAGGQKIQSLTTKRPAAASSCRICCFACALKVERLPNSGKEHESSCLESPTELPQIDCSVECNK
jgi:hypothetical protein